MSVLVIAEHHNDTLSPSTEQVVFAAAQLGDKKVEILVAGKNCGDVAKQAAALNNVAKVVHVDDAAYAHPLAENYAKLIHSLAENYSHVLVVSNMFGKNILPRAAALLDVAQLTDVIAIIDDNTFKRPIYAGNAIATVQSSDKIKLMTIRITAFEKCGSGGSAKVEKASAAKAHSGARFISVTEQQSDKPDLTAARVVVSGGRGLASGENFKILEELADQIGDCAIGASRAAVDAGYVPNDMQVGQTGKIVAPELYIAVGLSGAIQHLAGMKESKVIVAINTDENAPIFDVADYGLVADLFDAVPALTKALKA